MAPVGRALVGLAQPAVLRYGGVPLFIRNFIKDTQSQDIAFNLFFGRPILIGEHHDTSTALDRCCAKAGGDARIRADNRRADAAGRIRPQGAACLR